MRNEKTLIRIPLQFFGENDFDEFDDDFDDYEDDPEELVDDEDDDEGDEESSDDDEQDGDDDSPEDGDENGVTGTENSQDDLISELKALGYVGDDIPSLTADIKAKREAKEGKAQKKERKAAMDAGKAHVKGSKPGQAASGGGTGGITERHVHGFSQRMGCTTERARTLLAKHARLINGG